MKSQKTLQCMIASAASLATITSPAISAENKSEIENQEVVIVQGYRSSLQNARELKRNADIIQDSIVSEDIADFPDLNLAEALQRIPGVAISREAGEGRRVSLRGLGPSFTRVQLNGMEVLGNVDSPQDSRGQRSRDRAFDFNIFAAELFKRVDVEKTYSAEQDEGGMAGTIGLHTARPFDFQGFEAAVSGQLGTNSLTEDTQPRFTGLISKRWEDSGAGEFGALFSVAYSERETEEQGYNTYRWRPTESQGSTFGPNLSQQDIVAINSGELRFPRGNRLSVWHADQERLGITGSLQWSPTDTLELTFDILHGEFNNDRHEVHISSRGSGSTWLGGGATVNGIVYPNSTINEIKYNQNNEVEYLDVSGANIATETRVQNAENVFDQRVLSGSWDVNDRLLISGLIGYEKSTYKLPKSDKFYLENFGGVISDYTRDRFYAYNTYDFDTTDPKNWRAHEIDLEEFSQESEYENAKFDVNYNLSDSITLKSGLAYRSFNNSGSRLTANNLLRSAWEEGSLDDDVTQVSQAFTDHEDTNWLIVDQDKAFDYFNVNRAEELANQSASDKYTIEENTTAVYTQINWSGNIAGLPAYANAGIRYFSTDVNSTGIVNEKEETISVDYNDVLPATNFTLEVNPNLYVRAAYSQNINRPSLSALNASGTVSDQGAGGVIEIVATSGNPNLDPFTSESFDFSIEQYFGDYGSLALGIFHKKVGGIIGSDTDSDVTYADTGLSLDLLQAVLNSTGMDSQVATKEYPVRRFTRPVNYQSTDITGAEIAIQSDFVFLPGIFSNFGFSGNLTFVDAELDYASPEQARNGESYVYPLSGVSDTLANATLYFETDTFGAKISANYRSDWINSITPNNWEEDRNGFNSTTYVDFSAYYQLTDAIKFTFEGINLTDEREEQYSDSARRLYNSTTSGTTYYLGASFSF